MKIVPINNGYYNVKSINNEMFPSRVKPYDFSGIKGNADVLELEGKAYQIGTGDFDLGKDKTKSIHTKLVILNMCARLTTEEETFKLMISCPPKVFQDQSKKLPVYLKGKYNIKHNGLDKVVVIEEVEVQPETVMAYIVNDHGQWDGKKVVVIDVGGNTTIGVGFNDGDFSQDSIFEIPNGMFHLDTKIAQMLNGKHYATFDETDILLGRRNGALYNNEGENVLEVNKCDIEEIYMEHIKEIRKYADLMKWNMQNVDVLVTGGGGLELYETIVKNWLPKSVLSNDPLFDTLKGLELYAKWVYKK